MKELEYQQLVQELYDAIGQDGAWSTFLVRYAAALCADGVWFGYQAVVGSAGVKPCLGFEDAWVRAYDEEYHRHNPYIRYMGQLPVGLVFDAGAIVSTTELTRSRFHREFAAPQRFQAGATASVLRRECLDLAVLAFQWKDHRDSGLPRASLPHQQRMMRHVQAALALTVRLKHLRQARSDLLGAVEMACAPVIVCTAEAEVLTASRAAEALLCRGNALGCRDGRLVVPHCSSTHQQLGRAIRDAAALRSGKLSRAPRILVIPRHDAESAIEVAVFPAPRREPSLWHPEHEVLVFLRDSAHTASPAANVLRSVYGFSAREATVVALLARGVPLERIAESLAITRETVKTHLASAYHKTSTHTQAELTSKVLRGLGGLPFHAHFAPFAKP